MIRKNYGLPGILNGTTDSEEELMEQARKAVYKKLGVASGAKPIMHAPTDHDEDLYYVSKIKPIEIKNKFGHTQADKNRIAEAWLTRPADPIKPMVKKSMPILTYIDKVSNIYDGKPRKYDDQGKLLKPEQHPQDKYYEDEIKRIEKKGTSWAAKHFKKQDEQAEVKRIGKLVDKAAAKPENKKWQYKSRIDELAEADKITDQLTKLKDFGNSTNPHLNTKKTPS